jgi:hypothetical protein
VFAQDRRDVCLKPPLARLSRLACVREDNSRQQPHTTSQPKKSVESIVHGKELGMERGEQNKHRTRATSQNSIAHASSGLCPPEDRLQNCGGLFFTPHLVRVQYSKDFLCWSLRQTASLRLSRPKSNRTEIRSFSRRAAALLDMHLNLLELNPLLP